MTPPNEQPTLPAEGIPDDLEQLFISEQPPKLFPPNQNSNFGTIRKVLTDELQAAVDILTELVAEGSISTAVGYLGRWEDLLGLPKAPTGFSDAKRRVLLSARRQRGMFTRARRDSIIERFIADTFGAAADFLPGGIPFDGFGIPLFSGSTSLIGTYRVYEDVRNFSYELWILSTITPDIARLTRELTWLTPSGISFTIDNTHADVLNYQRIVRNGQPELFIRDNTGADTSGYADNGALANIAALAAPGLLNANVAGGNAGITFNGASSSIIVPQAAQLDVGDVFTLEAWLKPANVVSRTIFDKGANGFQLRISATGFLQLVKSGGAVVAQSTIALVAATTYHVAVVKTPGAVSIFINGVDRTDHATNYNPATVIENTAGSLYIGRTAAGAEWYSGDMDELALYNRAMSITDTLDHYNTGIDVATY